jgi:hypothetical protein
MYIRLISVVAAITEHSAAPIICSIETSRFMLGLYAKFPLFEPLQTNKLTRV